MSNFRVLIVDDERLSRRRIRRLLSLEPDCEVIGECSNGAEAVETLENARPDILFLDVQMPELDGFEVIQALTKAKPLIIFTSAYDEYALRAFEVHAFDYLLKPFDGRRLIESLHRAKARIRQERSGSSDDRLLELFESLSRARRSPDRIAVRNNGRVVFVKLEEIDWIEASDNYVCLHCARETHVVRETMSELEARLDPAQFLRVHRSAIVNLDRIKELQPWFRGDYRVILRDGTELTLTKNHREKLESRLLLGASTR
ncbi:MAG TPA: LytTR family DNA-binding domain-containing protein [Bryobacteraceae bacterium]|nr:LytTR family DNA-binding domain-containing protein [Bryobacteraceae bacterium]